MGTVHRTKSLATFLKLDSKLSPLKEINYAQGGYKERCCVETLKTIDLRKFDKKLHI